MKKIVPRLARLAALGIGLYVLVLSMGGTWSTSSMAIASPGQPPSSAAPATTPGRTDPDADRGSRPGKKAVIGKLNLNTATEDQLMLLPTVGPSKAERVVTWRKKNGGFKRTADLRRVKGFGYRTFKRLEPFLDIKGDTTLAATR
ncbi:MAG TPA: helix-hairpin-helix domain-containing protein [Kofleriaceae bacterium]|nr:helix-hairpin-helix domain-containing protein [Kofleriaceae bacterium]